MKRLEVRSDERFNRQMSPYMQRLASSQKVYGFTFQKHFQRLLKSIALSKGRSIVKQEDVDELKTLSEHINLEFNDI